MMRAAWIACAALLMAGCSQEAPPAEAPPPVEMETPAALAPPAPPVDEALLAALDSAFTAVEPSELGVIGAETINEALGPLIQSDAHVDHEALATEGEGAQEALHVSIRETGDEAVADIVRSGLLDDSVGASHLRITFRREADGWYPENGFRRMQCRRGASAGQWSANLCP